MAEDLLARTVWRKSSFSGGNGGTEYCVQVAALDDDRAALRDSKHPDRGTVHLTRGEMAAFVQGVKHHQFDDLPE